MTKKKDNKSINNEERKISIPKLPYGQGTINIMPDGETYIYKKNIEGKRRSVYGKSVKEVMSLMSALERDIKSKKVHKENITLAEAMYNWLERYKKPKLKKTSYDTLRKTISSRIDNHDIGLTRVYAIDADMIQEHLNSLNETDCLSYSTIKKCYDALNDFYRNYFLQGKIEINPMLAVQMVNRENVIKETKKIEFFESEDIRLFINQACSIFPWSRKPKYQYGFCLCANIFLGLRAGELLALKWKDVDFERGTIYVHENLQLVSNPSGVPRQVYETQSLKNYQDRHIFMNDKARHYLELQKEYSNFTDISDYVCCTRDGRHAAIAYLSNNIKEIENCAGTKVRAHVTHVIRHTCASLYFRKGVKAELIASLLGHSVDVCRSTYIHFVEEQKRTAVELLDDFNIQDV